MSEWDEIPGGESLVDKLLWALKHGTMTYTGTTAYVRFEDVERIGREMEAAAEREFDRWLDTAFPEELPGTHVEQLCFQTPGTHAEGCKP